MRVSLFGLFPRRTNLMDLDIEFIQLVLHTFALYIYHWWIIYTFIDMIWTWFHAYVNMFSRNSIYFLYMCICFCARHLAFLCTRWVASWRPWTCMFRFWSLDVSKVLVADQSGAAKA